MVKILKRVKRKVIKEEKKKNKRYYPYLEVRKGKGVIN